MSQAESPKTTGYNLLIRRGMQFAATAAVALVAAGCGTAKKAPTHPTSAPKTHVAPQTPAQRAPQPAPENAQTYGTSAARSKALFDAIQGPGKRVVELSRSGAIGPFDFYSSQTNSWRSQSEATKGWGWLQHNPQYGGSPDQVSTFVYMDADGEIDMHKGIEGLMTNVKGHALVEIDSNVESKVISPNIPFGRLGWQVDFVRDPSNPNSINPHDDSSLAFTIAAVRSIDRTALTVATASLNELAAN